MHRLFGQTSCFKQAYFRFSESEPLKSNLVAGVNAPEKCRTFLSNSTALIF